jgi:aspartokinase-like uncharacterized kinase
MIRILKVGGSLFDLPDLGPRLERLLAHLPPATNVLIAGGGKIADAVSDLQANFNLTDEETHWLCIEALGITSEALDQLIPAARRTVEPIQILQAPCPSLWILDTEKLLRDPNSHQIVTSLPRNATVTTDSIAAAAAVQLNATELILLKSTDGPTQEGGSRREQLELIAKNRLVDPHFPIACAPIAKIGWLNLRAEKDLRWL